MISLPLKRVHMELTNNCNFNCTFCPKSKMTRKKGFMDIEMAKGIIAELKEKNIAEKVTFHIMGEPFMHPKFFEVLAFAQQVNLKVGITTNGSFLSEEVSEKLSDFGVDQINISLQTPSEDTYKLRKSKGNDFSGYCKNILSLINTFVEKSPDSTVKLHFLNTKFNNSVKETIGPIDIISNNTTLRSIFSQWVEFIYDLDNVKNKELKGKVLRNVKKQTVNKWNVLEIYPKIFFETYVLDSWGTGLRKQTVKKSYIGYCSALSDHFGILWNGDVILCCKDFNGNTKIANVKEKSLYSILSSDDIQSIYNGFKKYRVIHPHCQECLGGSTRIGALAKQIGSVLFFDLLKNYFYNQKRLF